MNIKLAKTNHGYSGPQSIKKLNFVYLHAST